MEFWMNSMHNHVDDKLLAKVNRDGETVSRRRTKWPLVSWKYRDAREREEKKLIIKGVLCKSTPRLSTTRRMVWASIAKYRRVSRRVPLVDAKSSKWLEALKMDRRWLPG